MTVRWTWIAPRFDDEEEVVHLLRADRQPASEAVTHKNLYPDSGLFFGAAWGCLGDGLETAWVAG